MAILVFEYSSTAGALRLAAKLRDYGHKLRTISLHEQHEVPSDLDEVDGIVVSGGPQNANDDHPWLDAQIGLLQQAHEADVPIVGICLGSQILAKALGGEVGEVKNEIELGWHEVSLTEIGREDVIHTGVPWNSMQFHWHRQEVAKPPAGARVLAKSQQCEVQAWSLGMRTYGFQYHPEIYKKTIDVWAEDEPQALEDAGLLIDQLSEQTQANYEEFERVTDRLFESIALFLMPVDRRIEGVAKALHH